MVTAKAPLPTSPMRTNNAVRRLMFQNTLAIEDLELEPALADEAERDDELGWVLEINRLREDRASP